MPFRHQMNTEEVHPSDGGSEDPISDIEVVPRGHGEGVSEGDVPVSKKVVYRWRIHKF